MKKVFKLIFILILSFSFLTYLYAADDSSLGLSDAEEKALTTESKEQLQKAKEATDQYCSENAELKGCIYDENDTKYTTATFNGYYRVDMGGHGSENPKYNLKIKNVPLRKGYQVFTGDGEAVFIGCYKTTVPEQEKPAFDVGTTVYIFNIIYGNKCKIKKQYLVPAKDSIFHATSVWVEGYNKADGKKGVNDSNTAIFEWANFNGWVATANGECPNVAGWTSNAKWYTSPNHIYAFSQTNGDWIEINAKSFGKSEPYKNRPGCAVEDVAGREENQQLVDAMIQAEINNKQCPTDIKQMNEFEKQLDTMYETLRNNNKYRDLWARVLADKVNEQETKGKINDAIKAKIDECVVKICKLTSDEMAAVNRNKGSACKNGCTVGRVAEQSTSTKAKCYLCDNGVDGSKVYYWEEKEPYPQCELNKKVIKSKCVGTPEGQACIECLNNAYDKANLSKEKKECLIINELAAQLTKENVEKANDEAAANATDQEMEENREIREDMFNRKSILVELFIYDGPMPCDKILGPVLTQVVKAGITIIQIVVAILAIIKGMLILIPAVIAKDADQLKKASKTLVIMGVILALVIIFRPLVKIIGELLDYDISCII